MGLAAVAGVVAGGVGLAGAAMQSGAAEDAAKVQQKAAQSAQALQKQQFDQTQANLSPWMTTGQSALGALSGLFGLGPGGNGTPNTAAMMSALQNFPGYQFTQQQGLQSLDRVAASRGLTLSGAQLKDAQQFGQGLASSTFGQYLSGLQGLSSAGLGAAGSLGSFGQNYANNAGNMILSAGQAQAAGIVGSANAWTSGLQGALGNSLFAYNAMQNMQSPVSLSGAQAADNPVSNPYGDVYNPYATPIEMSPLAGFPVVS